MAVALMAAFSFSGCIREEALNMEADIEEATLTGFEADLQEAPKVLDDKIEIRFKTPLSDFEFAPEFKLTKGATISPESGTKLDFSTPQKYVVTSEDKKWTKEYVVEVIAQRTSVTTNYSFENMEQERNHHKFYEEVNGEKQYIWESGNNGFRLVAGRKPAEEYPTFQAEGYEGKGVSLITRTTGSLGRFGGRPIAAGSVFLGAFVNNNPRFGIPYPFPTQPKLVTGYFKYKAGEKMTKKDASSTLEKDTFDIYAILFEKRESNNFLTGNHKFQDERIVSIARLSDEQRIETGEWTKFEIPFNFVEGKSFDPNKEYYFTIVLTSSIEGGLFNGAVGSTLQADELKLITK